MRFSNSHIESERMIEQLKTFPLHEIGTSEWMLQHENLEKSENKGSFSQNVGFGNRGS